MAEKVAVVSVHALSAGSLTLPERFFVSPIEDSEARRTVPSLSFLIQHRSSNEANTASRITRLVFDLGIRRDVSKYPLAIREHVKTRQPLTSQPDVVESLRCGGLSPSDIDIVILSHVHWDHTGTPSDFPDSIFIVGNGALDLLNGKQKLSGSHSAFEKDLLPLDRTVQLVDTVAGPRNALKYEGAHGRLLSSLGIDVNIDHWDQLGILPHTIDLFDDGSLYIVSAPGHLPGHINLLCRIGVNRYVYLAGDACHDPRLLSGELDIAEWKDPERPDVICCIHADRRQAKETIAKIRALQNGQEFPGHVQVVFAHDAAWAKAAAVEEKYLSGKV